MLQVVVSSVLILSLIAAKEVYASPRIALVVGNSNYGDAPLENPVNDAQDMAAALQDRGFETELVLNADRRGFVESIRQFSRKLSSSDDAVGLFYYAGHGVEVDGINYLIPVDADIQAENDVEFEAINAGRVLTGMANSRNGLNLVILDACRNNPYKRSFRNASRGLARVNAPAGSLVLYSAQPGTVASDGSGRNGTFTKHLLKSMDKPGLTIERVFKETARGVQQETGGQQIPWVEGVILTDFYFIENDVAARAPLQTAKASSPEPARPVLKPDIQGTLQECRLHFEANRLTTGSAGNAFDCYQRVLGSDPGNIDALMGVREIEDTYANWARSTLQRGLLDKARVTLRKLKGLNPEHRAITELEIAIFKREEELTAARHRSEQSTSQRGNDSQPAESQAPEARASIAESPTSFPVALIVIQQSNGDCWLWGCNATIEVYVNNKQVVDLRRRLDLPINQVAWSGRFIPGKHKLDVKVHYKGKREEQFSGVLDVSDSDSISIHVGHYPKLMTGHFHPSIQVFHRGRQLADNAR